MRFRIPENSTWADKKISDATKKFGFSLLIFLAKQQFKDIKDGIAQTTQQIKENDKKTNERIDKLESKTEAEIANIKNDLSGIKGDFATTFVQREDFSGA